MMMMRTTLNVVFYVFLCCSFAEFAVMCHFIVLAVLWLTREPEFIPGWGSLMPNK